MKTRKILISLVNWQRYEDTMQCIHGIEMLKGVDYTISIVDNASINDSVEELRKEFPTLRIIQSEENIGYAGGHSLNVEYAVNNNYDAVWILNSDISVQQNSLEALVHAWETYGDNVYGSITLEKDNPNVVDFGGGLSWKESPKEFMYNIYKGVLLCDLPQDVIREVQSVEGCSMLIPIDVIHRYGFMKTDFFLYGEENDYCFSLYKYGVKSYVVRDSVVVHSSGASFKQSIDISWIMSYYRRRNYLYLMMEYFGMSRWKVLTINDSLFSQLKFVVKYICDLNYRSVNKKNLWLLKATWHAFVCKRGMVLNPNNYL